LTNAQRASTRRRFEPIDFEPGEFFAVDAVESAQTVRYIWQSLREWSDLHLGSSGKGTLAFLPEQEQDAVLAALPDPISGLKPIPKRGSVSSSGRRDAKATS
jgi:hypothetical protein